MVKHRKRYVFLKTARFHFVPLPLKRCVIGSCLFDVHPSKKRQHERWKEVVIIADILETLSNCKLVYDGSILNWMGK